MRVPLCAEYARLRTIVVSHGRKSISAPLRCSALPGANESVLDHVVGAIAHPE